MTTSLERQRDKVRALLLETDSRFQAVLPAHIPASKFRQAIMTSLSLTPKLYECTPASILHAAMESAYLGLLPDGGALGLGYLIPFKGRAKFVAGFRGYIELAHRSGKVRVFRARPVFERDTFSYRFGWPQELTHEPHRDAERGKLVAAYSVVELVNGGWDFDVMEAHEILVIKHQAPGAHKSDSPWNVPDWEPAMWAKTVIRRHRKVLTLSPEFHYAAAAEDAVTLGTPPPTLPVEEWPEAERNVTPPAGGNGKMDKAAADLEAETVAGRPDTRDPFVSGVGEPPHPAEEPPIDVDF